jgi:hypothetical protein
MVTIPLKSNFMSSTALILIIHPHSLRFNRGAGGLRLGFASPGRTRGDPFGTGADLRNSSGEEVECRVGNAGRVGVGALGDGGVR